jgi:hypothetical protein
MASMRLRLKSKAASSMGAFLGGRFRQFWYDLHRDELGENWVLARQEQPLRRIDPLE